MLHRVVQAYSIYDPELGYCQGVAFVVGLFLMKMPEEDAFALFVSLMQEYKLRDLFIPGIPAMGLAVYQFKHLLSPHFPDVFLCLEREGLIIHYDCRN